MQRQRVSSFEMTCHQPTMQSLEGQCGYVQAYPLNAVAMRWAESPSLPGVLRRFRNACPSARRMVRRRSCHDCSQGGVRFEWGSGAAQAGCSAATAGFCAAAQVITKLLYLLSQGETFSKVGHPEHVPVPASVYCEAYTLCALLNLRRLRRRRHEPAAEGAVGGLLQRHQAVPEQGRQPAEDGAA